MDMRYIKDSASALWDSVAEGWRHLTRSAGSALTTFHPGDKSDMPSAASVDDEHYLPTQSWSMLGGDLFEDDKRLVVRLEVPGMHKDDLVIEVLGDSLVVKGEKRFEQESSEGRWRVMQCAYGSFRRVVPLPAEVEADSAKASYRDGVLRIELPKRHPGAAQGRHIKVE